MTRDVTDASAGWRAEYAHQGVAPDSSVEPRQTATSGFGSPSSGTGEPAAVGTPRPPVHDATTGVERRARHGGEQ